MKKVLSLLMILVLFVSTCFALTGCGSDRKNNDTETYNSFKMTTEYAADKCVNNALNDWMKTKFLYFECSEFKYNITKTERSSRTFSGDNESGTMWYNAYGTVTFYNKYGDVLAKGDFSVFFGHNGVDSYSYIAEDTVVELS